MYNLKSKVASPLVLVCFITACGTWFGNPPTTTDGSEDKNKQNQSSPQATLNLKGFTNSSFPLKSTTGDDLGKFLLELGLVSLSNIKFLADGKEVGGIESNHVMNLLNNEFTPAITQMTVAATTLDAVSFQFRKLVTGDVSGFDASKLVGGSLFFRGNPVFKIGDKSYDLPGTELVDGTDETLEIGTHCSAGKTLNLTKDSVNRILLDLNVEQWDGVDTTEILLGNDTKAYLLKYMFGNVRKYFKVGVDLDGDGLLGTDEGCK